jgi:glycosyltransferase involved in cell wall biosynthesis
LHAGVASRYLSTVPQVILPVLDEVAALPWVLGRMPAGFNPIIVDNGSVDGSGEVASRLGALVVSEQTRGFGSACWAGLTAAYDDVVCFMDADGSLDPRDLPRLSAPVESGDIDLMLGARRPEPGAWPLHARLGNKVLMTEVRRRTALRLSDLGPMRVARRTALIGLNLVDRRSGWPLEMVLRAHQAGWRVGEVPVAYRSRAGRSKVTGTVRGTLQAVGDMASLLR